jgi:tetratricopeptide (TPR) repeat protein
MPGFLGGVTMQTSTLDRMRLHLIPIAVLVAVTFAVYGGALSHEFLLNWDDSLYVTDNETIRGITGEHVKEAFSRFYVGNYAPVQIISYMIDYSVGGLRPGMFILSNVLLHAMNGLLLYWLLIRITQRRGIGFLAACVFLLHPVQVESVAWISQRKNLLALFFFLASFHAYLSYRVAEKRMRALSYTVSVAAFALALLSKSVAIVLPLVLFLYDWCYRDPSGRPKWLANKIPFLLIAGAALVVALQSQLPEHDGGRMSYAIEGPLSVFYTMLTVLVRYFKILFWPTELSALYMPPMKLGMDTTVALSALFAVALAVLGLYLYRRRKELFFWYALFFIGLLPVSQIVPLVTFMNDRYLYFPMVGASAFVVLAASSPADTVSPVRKGTVAVVLGLLILPLPWLSWQRTFVWSNDVSLWMDVARKTPESPLAWNGLGMSYVDAGRFDEAAGAFLQALSRDPDYELALNNIGALYNSQGKLPEARPYLLKATELFPENINGWMNLGINYAVSREYQQAELMFQRALTLNPRSADALVRLGDVYLKLRKPGMARRSFQQATRLAGRTADLEYRLACVESLSGHHREALERLESALTKGYNDYQNIAQDACLDPLREESGFRTLLRKYFGM